MMRYLIIVFLLLSLCGCRQHTHNILEVHNELEAPLDSLFGSMFASDEPGAVVGVLLHGEPMYLGTFGKARLDTNKPFTDSTSTNIAAATKMFITTAVLKLAEQGKLSLYDTVDKFFPNLNSPVFKDITVRCILSHTSGLPDNRPLNRNQWRFYILKHESKFGSAKDYMLYGGEPEMVKYIESVDSLENPPGTVFRNQDPPFMLLSTVIEAASGMPFEEYMRDSIFASAGLTETRFFDTFESPANEAHAYAFVDSDVDEDVFVSADGRWAEYDYGESPFFATKADRGIFTTPRDYFKWLKAVLGGEVIRKETLRKRWEWQVNTGWPNIGYGLGLFLEDRPGYPYKAFNMSNNGGFSVYQCYYPDGDFFIFVLSNRADWDRFAVSHAIDDIFRQVGWI